MATMADSIYKRNFEKDGWKVYSYFPSAPNEEDKRSNLYKELKKAGKAFPNAKIQTIQGGRVAGSVERYYYMVIYKEEDEK